MIPRNFEHRKIPLPLALDLQNGEYLNFKNVWAEHAKSTPPGYIPEMLQAMGLEFTGSLHCARDDVTNWTNMLRYMDAQGVELRVDWDKTLTQPLCVHIDPEETVEIQDALLCIETLGCGDPK